MVLQAMSARVLMLAGLCAAAIGTAIAQEPAAPIPVAPAPATLPKPAPNQPLYGRPDNAASAGGLHCGPDLQ